MSGQARPAGMLWVRRVAVLVTVTIGSAAFALSFAALRELAIMAHTPAGLAWLWPVIVDGTIIQATVSMLVLASNPQRRWFLWVLAAGVLVSITGNSVHAAMAGDQLPWWAAALVAAVAPVSLLVDTHGLSVLFRAAHRDPAPVAIQAPDRADNAATSVAQPVQAEVPADPVVKGSSRRDPVKVARAVAMRAEGRTYAEIADTLGVSRRTAAKYVAAGGDPAREAAVQPIHVVRPVQQTLPLPAAALGGGA
ncbi:DUF2637 domain-containing protein [Nocardia sp. BMG51109]|uniref:DUF2637 domain-containing protein n=1 Tax=Nocardia sp. BMG51109 TaxID=1056816 RepID=UPI0004AD9ABA|nr:DUF2637 domain-containing protein [Nocardia sp. BMG51109]